MLVSISDDVLRYFFETPLKDIRGKQAFSRDVITAFKRVCIVLRTAENPDELACFEGLQFSPSLSGLPGFSSIQLVNGHYVVLKITEKGGNSTILADILSIETYENV